jgi:hypothetical protein
MPRETGRALAAPAGISIEHHGWVAVVFFLGPAGAYPAGAGKLRLDGPKDNYLFLTKSLKIMSPVIPSLPMW